MRWRLAAAVLTVGALGLAGLATPASAAGGRGGGGQQGGGQQGGGQQGGGQQGGGGGDQVRERVRPGPGGGARRSTPAPTPALRDALSRAYAEERTVEATYRNVLAALGDVRPFVRIAAAEDTHAEAIERVAASVGVTLPTGPWVGDPAPATLVEACAAAAVSERADGALYTELLPSVQAWPQVVRVFENLRSASLANHLPAFERCASGLPHRPGLTARAS